MKKSIKFLICIMLIGIIFVPNVSVVNAAEPTDEAKILWDTTTITSQIKDSGSGEAYVKQQSAEVVVAWYNTFVSKYGEKEEFKNLTSEVTEEKAHMYVYNAYIFKRSVLQANNNSTYDEINQYYNWFSFSDVKEYTLECWRDTVKEYNKKNNGAAKDLLNKINGAILNNGEDGSEYWKPDSTGGNDKITTLANRILGMVQIVGSVIAILVIVIIGIKYMLGSVEEKAKYKESMIPYIVGCVLLFGITNIAVVIYDFAINI